MAQCFLCNKKTSRYDDVIACANKNCGRIFHPKCINVTPESFTDMNCSGQLNEWVCKDCESSLPNQTFSNKSHSQSNLEIATVIRQEMAKYHDELMSISHKIDAMITSQAALKEQYTMLSAKLECLDEVKLRVTKLEEERSEEGYEKIYDEIEDRRQREDNLIIMNVPESASSNSSERMEHDNKLISNILEPVLVNMNFKTIRLGKRKMLSSNDFDSTKPPPMRPIKVIFKTGSGDARSVIRQKEKLTLGNFKIKRDMTVSQRALIRKTYKELDDRKREGETNIQVKFVNNTPKIVYKEQNSKN